MTGQTRWGVPIELGERRILGEGSFRWLRAICWMVILFLAVATSFGPAMSALRELLPADAAPLHFLTRCAGAIIALGAYALLVRLGEGRIPQEIAISPALKQLLSGVLLGLTMFGSVMAVMVALGAYNVTVLGVAPAWRAAGLAIEAGVVEEVLVRGVALRLLWRAFGPAPAFIISAALFGAGHLPNSASSIFAALCVAIEAGVMLGALYALTGRSGCRSARTWHGTSRKVISSARLFPAAISAPPSPAARRGPACPNG